MSEDDRQGFRVPWGFVTLLVLAALFPAFMAAVAIHEGSAMARGIAGMVTGLIVLWIFGAAP